MNRRAKYILVSITILFLVIGLYCFLTGTKIELTRTQALYDGNGILLSKCTMKNNLPWNGSFVANADKSTQGTYPKDFYTDGILTKSIYFLDEIAIVGVLSKGRKAGTYKVKVTDEKQYTNNSLAQLIDAEKNVICEPKIKDNALLIVTDCSPGGYTVRIKQGDDIRSLYEFEISDIGSVSFVVDTPQLDTTDKNDGAVKE